MGCANAAVSLGEGAPSPAGIVQKEKGIVSILEIICLLLTAYTEKSPCYSD